MPTDADLLPAGRTLRLYPGNPEALVFTWPSSIAGRTFTASLSGTSCTCTVSGTDLTVDITTPSTEGPYVLTVTETTSTSRVVFRFPVQVRTSTGSQSATSFTVLDGSTSITVSPTENGLAGHLADTTDAHDASAISVLDAGALLAATNVETALAEVAGGLANHLADTSDAHDGSAISVADSAGYFTATDAEATLAELHVRRVSPRPVLITDQLNPLRNAVADGSVHPLSERFASLAAAQAVFPRATATTEQIDRHALQYALDNYPTVVLPMGTIRVDAEVFGGDGTYDQGLDGQTLMGAGMDVSIIQPVSTGAAFNILSSGNARGVVTPSNPDSTEAPAQSGCTWRDFTIDGNKANLTGSTGVGLRIFHCSNRQILNVRVHDTKGGGIRDYGVNDAQTYNAIYRDVIVENCGGHGLQLSLRNRHVVVASLVANANGSSGLYMDASQNVVLSAIAYENAETGITCTGTFRSQLHGLVAWNNDQHGIYISGSNEMVGSDWTAYNNGVATSNTYDDIHFTGTNHGTYGINRRHVVSGVTAGPTTHATGGGTVRYAVYFDDAVTDSRLENVVAITGNTGIVRLPTGAAHGVSVGLRDGSEVANVVVSTGATETLAWGGVHNVTMDQNCTFSFSTAPASGIAASMTVIVSGAFTPTWPAAVDWASGSEPTYGSPSVYEFITTDGGTNVLGFLAGASLS